MNYLAHLHLSGGKEGLILGNFIGDAVKGKRYELYPEPVQQGILMHRFIDHFADTHPINDAAKGLLYDVVHKYAGVVLDMFYDHFLAVQWSRYQEEPLEAFADRMYQFLLNHRHEMPPKAAEMLPYMVQGNWLVGYQTLDGLQRALSGLSRRTRFVSGMENVVKELWTHYDTFQSHFEEFYPLMREQAHLLFVDDYAF